jgi:hypothetical protein
MRKERRHRSAENDSFGISPLGRGCAVQGNVPAPRKFPSKTTLTAVVADVPGASKGSALALFPGRA